MMGTRVIFGLGRDQLDVTNYSGLVHLP